MDEPEERQIPIKSIVGREEGQKLIGCYFTQKPDGAYNFHSQNHIVKGREIRVGRSFRFFLEDAPGVFWTLTLNSDADEVLCGTWNDKENPSLEEGTFQAQAGGNAEDAASACA